MSDLWQLPGPSNFLRTIVADLDAGRSCVVIRPLDAPPTGLEGRIRAALRATRDWASVTLGPDDGLPGKRYVDELFDRFALATADDTSRRTVGQLAAHPDWHYRVLQVDATTADQDGLTSWWRFLAEYGAASQAVNPQERTPILTVIDGERANGLPDQNVLLTTRWWWSVVQPLDTAVHLSALTRGRDVDPAFEAACAEVGGFDLQLAEEFVMRWDGAVRSVPELLADYAASWPDHRRRQDLGIEASDASNRPRTEHLAAWDAGILDHWTGRPTWHLAAAAPNQKLEEHIGRLIWKSQLATLLPEIETHRLEIARWCDSHRRHLRGARYDDVDILQLEYAPLLDLMKNLPHARRDDHRQRVLRWMRDTRNALAHARTLEPGDIRHGRTLLRQLSVETS